MNFITLSALVFRGLLRRLQAEGGVGLDVAASLSRHHGSIEIIGAPAVLSAARRDVGAASQSTPPPSARRLRVLLTDDFASPSWLPASYVGVLMIGRQSRRGEAAGWMVDDDNRLLPVDALRLLGPGMHQIRMTTPVHRLTFHTSVSGHVRDQAGTTTPGLSNDNQADELSSVEGTVHSFAGWIGTGSTAEGILPSDASDHLRWSRTIGALGPAWFRLIAVHFVLIGAGRTGGVFARLLLRAGVRVLTILDPDTLQLHNLGEADDCLTDSVIGVGKAQSLAHALGSLYPNAAIRAVSDSVTHVRSLAAMKSGDFLICAADHDSARLASSCAASLFARPLLDVATGIVSTGGGSPPHSGVDTAGVRGELRRGISVRLILPSPLGGCLLCTGGLRQSEAGDVLRSAETEREFHNRRQWRQERFGSLASLNHLAASLGMRMIEDLISDQIVASQWLQLEFDGRGQASIEYPVMTKTTRGTGCLICDRLAFRADSGLPDVPGLISDLHQ